MQKIEVTTDYSIFKPHESNRPIEKGNLKKIEFSIKTNNMLALRPILVDGQMRVIDGQHRLEAAKNLGVAIYYQVSGTADSADMILLNANQKGWTIENYIRHYANEGNINYIKFIEYCKKRNITINELYYLLKKAGGRFGRVVKSGAFDYEKCVNEYFMDSVLLSLDETLQVIKRYRLDNPTFLTKSFFKSGLIKFLSSKEIDMDVFLKKIATKSSAIKSCVSIVDYVQMFSDIYNWRNPNPID